MQGCRLSGTTSATYTTRRRSRVRCCTHSNRRNSRRVPLSIPLSPLLLLLLGLCGSLQHAARAFLVVRSPASSIMVRRVPNGIGLVGATSPPQPPANGLAAAAAGEGAGAGPATTAAGVEIAEGLKGLAELFDVLLIDQWGVMHDGHAPYPGAVECMRELQRLGKHIILLSNSSKRKAGSLV